MERPRSWFPVPALDDVPADLARLMGRFVDELGFVPNVIRAYAWRPDRLRAWYRHFEQLHRPTAGLDAAAREMIAVVVSRTNDCPYCLASHSAALRLHLGDADLADRIASDHRTAGLDDRLVAVLDFCVKLTTAPTTCEAADVGALTAAGLSLEEAWDVVELASMYNFTNRLTLAAGIVPNEEYARIGRTER